MTHAIIRSCTALIRIMAVAILAIPPASRAADEDHARLIAVDVPYYMISGERYPVRIEYKNSGNTVWSADQGYQLDWADPALSRIWGNTVTSSLFTENVAPGETVLIEFEITAPPQTGLYELSWQLKDAMGNHFGEPAIAKALRVEHPDNQSRVMMQLVPDQVTPGESFTIMIQLMNIGRTTWSAANGYHLAPIDSNAWNIKRLDIKSGTRVAPNETVMFKAEFKAPTNAGDYHFQWQMRHNDTYFGDLTPLVKVRVGGKVQTAHMSEFVYQSVPRTMLAGDTQAVVVQFKNTGQQEWRSGQVDLVSPRGQGLVWAIDAVEMKPGETVKPGEFLVFRFNIHVPQDAGVYPLQWQLRDRQKGLFGQLSDNLSIEVK